MNLKRTVVRVVLPVAVAVFGAVVVAGCTERRPAPAPQPKVDPAPPPATTTPSTPTPAPTTGSPPVIAPSTATDVETKKGTETGMIGGESGTVSSSGKPGQGTASGAGTGPAQSSGEETVNKK